MLYEQYRPRSWSEVVGQDKALGQLEALRSRGGLAGRAYWVSGQSGTGKTTLARLIASAPELLEALERLAAATANVITENGSPLMQVRDEAIRTIAKATG